MKRQLAAIFCCSFTVLGACSEGLELVGEITKAPTGADPITSPTSSSLCATTDEVITRVLGPKCVGCHGSARNPSRLDLASPGVRERLRADSSRVCGKRLVFTRPYVGGHLFDKLAGPVPDCGHQMPLQSPPLSRTEISCLQDWLEPGPPVYPDVNLPGRDALSNPYPGDIRDAGAAAEPPPDAKPTGVRCTSGAEAPWKVITPICGPCHGAAHDGGLDLISRDARERLLAGRSKNCGGKPMVILGPPMGGHFFDKIAGDIPAACGRKMPFDGTSLGQGEVECLKMWLKGEP